MREFFTSPLFSIPLCIFSYLTGYLIQKKTKLAIANPLLIAIILVIITLKTLNITLAEFNNGGNFISFFLTPATAVLAISIYNKINILKENLIPIIIGSAVGSAASMGSVYLMCRIFGIEEKIRLSLLPKSVTTPIAMAVSEQIGGIPSITVAAVVITGIFSAIVAPFLISILKLKDKTAIGVGIGTSSHAMGTSKALEIGETEGAMSGVAIGISGIITVIYSLIIR